MYCCICFVGKLIFISSVLTLFEFIFLKLPLHYGFQILADATSLCRAVDVLWNTYFKRFELILNFDSFTEFHKLITQLKI